MIKSELFWGAWVAQSVKRLALDFGSSHDLTVHGIEPCVGLRAESAWDSLSLSVSAPSQLERTHILSLPQNE